MHVLARFPRSVRQHRPRRPLITPTRAPTLDRSQSVTHRTLLRAIAKRTAYRLSTLDDRIFADDELSATTRGWHVARPRPFLRTYRDPRWDQVGLEPVPPSPGRAR